MTRRAQDLLRVALALPAPDRAEVAAELLASLNDEPEPTQPEVEDAWVREIERRGRRAVAGDFAGEAWGDVRTRIAGRFDQR